MTAGRDEDLGDHVRRRRGTATVAERQELPLLLKRGRHLIGVPDDLVAEFAEQLEAKTVALRGLLDRCAGQFQDQVITGSGLWAQHRIEQLRERIAAGFRHAPTSTGSPRWRATPPWQRST